MKIRERLKLDELLKVMEETVKKGDKEFLLQLSEKFTDMIGIKWGIAYAEYDNCREFYLLALGVYDSPVNKKRALNDGIKRRQKLLQRL
jgi:hypothetical protein